MGSRGQGSMLPATNTGPAGGRMTPDLLLSPGLDPGLGSMRTKNGDLCFLIGIVTLGPGQQFTLHCDEQ